MADRLEVVVGMVDIVVLSSAPVLQVILGLTGEITSMDYLISTISHTNIWLLTNIILSPELHLAPLPHLLGITRKPKDLSQTPLISPLAHPTRSSHITLAIRLVSFRVCLTSNRSCQEVLGVHGW
jgi:hypothetical protein